MSPDDLGHLSDFASTHKNDTSLISIEYGQGGVLFEDQ